MIAARKGTETGLQSGSPSGIRGSVFHNVPRKLPVLYYRMMHTNMPTDIVREHRGLLLAR